MNPAPHIWRNKYLLKTNKIYSLMYLTEHIFTGGAG